MMRSMLPVYLGYILRKPELGLAWHAGDAQHRPWRPQRQGAQQLRLQAGA